MLDRLLADSPFAAACDRFRAREAPIAAVIGLQGRHSREIQLLMLPPGARFSCVTRPGCQTLQASVQSGKLGAYFLCCPSTPASCIRDSTWLRRRLAFEQKGVRWSRRSRVHIAVGSACQCIRRTRAFCGRDGAGGQHNTGMRFVLTLRFIHGAK